MNFEILFDAPNIIRLNKDLIYQVSNSGNVKGAQSCYKACFQIT